MTIYCDNLNNIQLAKNPVFHARTKNIEVHYHFVHERVVFGEVELQYVSDGSTNCSHLHQAPCSRQVTAILGCAWVASPRRAQLEGDKSLKRSSKGVGKEWNQVG